MWNLYPRRIRVIAILYKNGKDERRLRNEQPTRFAPSRANDSFDRTYSRQDSDDRCKIYHLGTQFSLGKQGKKRGWEGEREKGSPCNGRLWAWICRWRLDGFNARSLFMPRHLNNNVTLATCWCTEWWEAPNHAHLEHYLNWRCEEMYAKRRKRERDFKIYFYKRNVGTFLTDDVERKSSKMK